MPEKKPIRLRDCALLSILLGAAGCETVPLEPSPEFVGDMVVSTDYAQFFRLGPQQAGGADLSLRTGERVMLQRKEFGYSRVQLEDGQVGYMANEEIQPAPPEPKGRKGLYDRGRGEKTKRGKRGAQPQEEEIYDEIVLPDPNLDIMPEDLPVEPLPDLVPAPVDKPEDKPQREPVKVQVPAPPAPAGQTPPAEAPAEAPAEKAPPVSTST